MFYDMFIHTKSDSVFLEFSFQTVMQMQKDRNGFKMIFSIGRLAESDRLPRNTLLPWLLQTSSPGRDGMGSSEKRKKQMKGLSFIFITGTFQCLDGMMGLFCKVAVTK